MKCRDIFTVFIILVKIISAKELINNNHIEVDRTSRIANGVVASNVENLDYVLLKIVFHIQMKMCGGTLVAPRFVLTTAKCIKDPVEGIATVVNATFPQLPANNINTKSRIFIHDLYDEETFANNIAIIKLIRDMIPDGKTLMMTKFYLNTPTDNFADQVMRFCGFGSISNYYTLPKSLMCTDLYVQPAADCSSLSNTICTYWTDRDNNVCGNDYGGPLYSYIYLGSTILQHTVGLASFSPDTRHNAQCLDGHKVVFTLISAYAEWIESIVTFQPNPF